MRIIHTLITVLASRQIVTAQQFNNQNNDDSEKYLDAYPEIFGESIDPNIPDSLQPLEDQDPPLYTQYVGNNIYPEIMGERIDAELLDESIKKRRTNNERNEPR